MRCLRTTAIRRRRIWMGMRVIRIVRRSVGVRLATGMGNGRIRLPLSTTLRRRGGVGAFRGGDRVRRGEREWACEVRRCGGSVFLLSATRDIDDDEDDPCALWCVGGGESIGVAGVIGG